MIDRQGRDDRERVLGALILIGAVGIALLIVGIRLGPGREAAPTPTPLPPPTPLPTAPPPPTPTAVATPTVAPALAALGRPPVICLDPGHGGADLGNVRLEDGRIVLQEKDFTLEHALLLGERLRSHGIEVVFTRTTDTEVNPDNADVNGDATVAAGGGEANSDQLDDLQARINVCNQAAADLLVSMHYNGAENVFLSGYEVWYNQDRPFSDRSLRFATLMRQELGARLAAAGYEAVDRGIGMEDHAMTGPARPGKLDPSAMPGAVVEGLFLSNDDDAAFVVTDAATAALVSAYEQAILRFFVEDPG